jgi:hypothetical protein
MYRHGSFEPGGPAMPVGHLLYGVLLASSHDITPFENRFSEWLMPPEKLTTGP